MNMRKLKMLIADDRYENRNDFYNWFKSLEVFTFFDTPVICEFINEVNTQNLNLAMNENARFDFAFIDMEWEYEESEFPGTDGGYFIIEKIEKHSPNVKIIALTKHGSRALPKWHIPAKGIYGEYDAIIKGEYGIKDKQNLYKYIENWQLSRIKQINDPEQWRNLLFYINEHNYEGTILFENNEIKISDFLIIDIQINNVTYFKHQDILTALKNLLSYPKKGEWGNETEWGKLTTLYFKFLEIDKENGYTKFKRLEAISEDYILNLMKILMRSENQNRAKINNLSYHQSKYLDPTLIKMVRDIDEDYFENLIIRNIVFAICKIANLLNKEEWKSVSTIVNLFANNTEATNKHFMPILGISTKMKFVDISKESELFYTEKIFLERFNNDWLKKNNLK